MANIRALNEKGETILSSKISNLTNSDERLKMKEQNYTCPYCKTKMTYSESGIDGCFKHHKSTPLEIKERCPYYSGLLNECPDDTYMLLYEKKKEVQLFLEKNNIQGYKVISYYNEARLVKYLENNPHDDFIIVGKRLDKNAYSQLKRNVLILKRKALVKYITANNKKIIQTFVGTKTNIFVLLRHKKDFPYGKPHFEPYTISIEKLLKKDFSFRGRLMEQSDVLEFTPKKKI
jgi:hypothetical protein